MRIPVILDFVINAFSGAGITELESGITNGIVKTKQVNGAPVQYVTQRPAINIFEDVSATISDARGRAIHYWDEDSVLWILNNDTLYKNNTGVSSSTTPSAGTEKCLFLELNQKLILLDAENDQGFTITTGDVVTEIIDTDFPPKQTPAVGLAHGGAVLNNVLYVLGENGIVYGSGDGDAESWNALDFLGASRQNDGGVFLAKHHDTLAIFGPSTTEFFYDAGNPSGLALSRRQDVSYNIGCSKGQTCWEVGDRVFFVGVTDPGALQVYTLESFGIRKISSPTIDSFLSQAILQDGFTAIGSGYSANGHHFYVLTVISTPSDVVPDITLVYDESVGLWYRWGIDSNDITEFPLIGWTKREGETERPGEGILANGDIVTVNDNMIPTDTLAASVYVEAGYVEIGYVVNTGSDGTAIDFKVRMGMADLGTNEWKFPRAYRYAGNETTTSQTLTLKWSNEDSDSFGTGKTMDTSKYQKITRCGRFRRRNHELSMAGTEQIRIEALEVDF